MGYNPQESPKNTINTMGTLLVVHPLGNIFPGIPSQPLFLSVLFPVSRPCFTSNFQLTNPGDSYFYNLGLAGIFPPKGTFEDDCLFPRWDMLVP